MNDYEWIVPGIASPIIYAAVTIGDKRVISTLRLGLGSFFLFIGSVQLSISLIIIAILGWPDAPVSALLASYGGGFLWGMALMLMFLVLRREEVSRVTPVWQTSPVFAAIFALALLDESIAWHGWLAVFLVVAGAVAVSIGRSGAGLAAFALRPTFFILIAGAAIIGVAQLSLKVGSEDLDVWHNMAFRGAGLWTTIALPWVRPDNFKRLYQWARTPSNAATLFITEGIGPFVGNVFLLMAIASGPVSLVSALLGTRPVFVLLGTLLLGWMAKDFISERFTRQDLIIKSGATCAVVAGIVIISLG